MSSTTFNCFTISLCLPVSCAVPSAFAGKVGVRVVKTKISSGKVKTSGTSEVASRFERETAFVSFPSVFRMVLVLVAAAARTFEKVAGIRFTIVRRVIFRKLGRASRTPRSSSLSAALLALVNFGVGGSRWIGRFKMSVSLFLERVEDAADNGMTQTNWPNLSVRATPAITWDAALNDFVKMITRALLVQSANQAPSRGNEFGRLVVRKSRSRVFKSKLALVAINEANSWMSKYLLPFGQLPKVRTLRILHDKVATCFELNLNNLCRQRCQCLANLERESVASWVAMPVVPAPRAKSCAWGS
jgi:hypothetical protein